MKIRYTTLTTVLLLIPCLLVFTLLKGANKNSIGVEENELKSNGFINVDHINEVPQVADPPEQQTNPRQCNCDCDKSLTSDRLVNQLSDDRLDISSDEISDKTFELKSKNTIIFVITPTYTRPTQMADMTRLSQTLSLVRDIFWIVSEDSNIRSLQISELLNRTNIPSVHLLGPRPVTHMDKRSGRGVSNRLKALEYLRETYSGTDQEGVIYFADDDNAYDIRIFDEIRDTKKVSVFPVGLIAKLGLSSPIVNKKTAQIVGFHDPFIGRRKYAVDMAGFAVNLQLFLSRPKAKMPYKVGYEEDYFIRSLGIQFHDLEPKANNCTQILVWHTKTSSSIAPNYSYITKNKAYNETNLPLLYDNVIKNT